MGAMMSSNTFPRAAIAGGLWILICGACGGDPFVVTGTSPAQDQANVGTGSLVTFTFNRKPKDADASFVPDAGAFVAFIQRDPITGMLMEGNTFIAGPDVNGFAPMTAYTATLTATDQDGNGLAAPFVLHFTTSATAETTAPAK
jgi:hypothetical protein